MKIDFDKMDGLVPAIIQDATTKNVLMLGFMNKEAYEKTLETKHVTFWSRTRQTLWTKGETSGHFLNLVDMKIDCDNDTLLVRVNPVGPTCHTGTDTCWGEENEGNPLLFLTELQDFINKRKQEMPEGSYTTSLFTKGVNKIAQKVGEEALETVIEATNGTDDHLVYEASDLLYHLIVLLTHKGLRIEDVAEELHKRHDPEWDKQRREAKMLIDYKKVNIYHKDGAPVLHDVDFHVDEGEFIYVIGRVGSGKSSLLKTIYFEMDIESAENAFVLNHDLRELKQKYIPALRRQMGIIFQDFQLLGDRTVYENLKFVLKATGWKKNDEIDERIHDVLEDVDMVDFIDRYPHELSGGEQQRIAIARAILNRPKLIVADEPTGNLDLETAANIIQLLRQVTQMGTAVIMTTHNISLLNEYPGIVYRCIDGRLEDITETYNTMALYEDEESNDKAAVDYSAREDLSI